MINLDDTYRRIARPWTHQQLAAAYHRAALSGADPVDPAHGEDLTRPIALLATAIPPASTLNVAIHVIHVLPDGAQAALREELMASAERNAADALHRAHQALELDSQHHASTAEEWLATVYDIAIPALRSARQDQEPPTVVRQTQEAISWLSRSIFELDRESAETAATIAELLARLLTLWLFADQARGPRAG
jgi:RecG-like helicase